MLLVVVLIFFICNISALIINIIEFFLEDVTKNQQVIKGPVYTTCYGYSVHICTRISTVHPTVQSDGDHQLFRELPGLLHLWQQVQADVHADLLREEAEAADCAQGGAGAQEEPDGHYFLQQVRQHEKEKTSIEDMCNHLIKMVLETT